MFVAPELLSVFETNILKGFHVKTRSTQICCAVFVVPGGFWMILDDKGNPQKEDLSP